MRQITVNTSTIVSVVLIMLPMLLKTKSLKSALLKTVTFQVSTLQTVSSRRTPNHLSLSALSLLNHIVFAFPRPPIVRLSLVQHYLPAYPLCLRLLLVHRPRLAGPRGGLQRLLVLPGLLKVLLLMRLR